MLYLNIATDISRRAEFFRAAPIDRATWLCLLLYCASNENGGRIPGCKTWGDDTWQQGALVKKAEVHRETGLWSWNGDDLVVQHYPVDQEAELRRKRAAGKKGNEVRWGASRSAVDPASPKRKETERNETKRNLSNVREGESDFPEELEQALKRAPEFDPDFVRFEWEEAKRRGGLDYKRELIRSWSGYLSKQKRYRAANAEPLTLGTGGQVPGWQVIQALGVELEEVRRKLGLLPRLDQSLYPEEFAKVEAKRAPLRARRDELRARIADLQKENPQ